MTPTEIAVKMGVPPGRVRSWCRKGILRHTIKTHTGRYMVSAAALKDPVWWSVITGSNDQRNWGPAWTGPRMSRKQELRQLRKHAPRHPLQASTPLTSSLE